MFQVTKGKISKPIKTVIYGSEGIGKSTLASQFPQPVFIDTEGSTAHMDVDRLPKPRNWNELILMVEDAAKDPAGYKTLVLDTADWSETLCATAICEERKVKGIEDFGYGKGYSYLAEQFGQLLRSLDRCIEAGLNVTVTAHAMMRKFEQPDEMGAYDRWEMKLSKKCAPMLKEWCDLLLFCNYQTNVVHSDSKMEKAKAVGGKRVMYTTHHPCWDAKNRFDLPDELPMEYAAIAHIYNGKSLKEQSLEKIAVLEAESGIEPYEIEALVAEKKLYPEGTRLEDYTPAFLSGWVIKHWEKIVEAIKN